ncbi:NnrS family protein [Kordiimonas sp.]|uniref:NnrS family protein n=1 Tax=Kordiimonas sp. TaxID=1970157 RepID=UPI003A929D03
MARQQYHGPAFLSHGFRLFFLMAGLTGFLLVPGWLYLFFHGGTLPSGMVSLDWHIHEMIFGYLAAVIAGFLLTAIPNWTGRLPISGAPLACLVLLWFFGRVLMLAPVPDLVRAGGDSLFLIIMTFVAAREVKAGKNWRNAPVCLLVGLFALGNITFHVERLGMLDSDVAVRAALSVISVLIALIGGRIVPSFTTNWLIKSGAAARPVPFNSFDKAVLALTVLALAFWSMAPEGTPTGVMLILAGALQFVRLARWQGWVPWRNALVLVLHVAYLWLPVGLVLLGFAAALPEVVPMPSAGIHALTAGLMGMMTVAVMSRATLGHTGRELAAGAVGCWLYVILFTAALLRVVASLIPEFYASGVMMSGVLWSLAFLIFVVHYGAMTLTPRLVIKGT